MSTVQKLIDALKEAFAKASIPDSTTHPTTIKLSPVEWLALYDQIVGPIGIDKILEVAYPVIGPENAAMIEAARAKMASGQMLSTADFPPLTREERAKALLAIEPIIPGDSRAEKLEWLIPKFQAAFPDPARALAVMQYARSRMEEYENPDLKPQPKPPVSSLTGNESGFLWKPVSESSGKLVVLLPAAYTSKTSKQGKLVHNGQTIETTSRAHNSTPQPNGNREHYRFDKAGGGYPAGVEFRIEADGVEWSWRVTNSASRTTDVKATIVGASDDAPSKDQPSEPAQPVSGFAYEPGGSSVMVRIPPSYQPWQLSLFSRRKHATIHQMRGNGPNYSVLLSPAQLRQASLDAGDDGSLLVFVNTSVVPPIPGATLKNAGWRVMDASMAVYGNATQLKPGEDK